MKKQNTAVRRAALAVLYLAVFAAAVMYLRVTISVPAEGDDKLTLNGWLYDMGRMSFWQYALQDLKERLSFFLLKQVLFSWCFFRKWCPNGAQIPRGHIKGCKEQ